MVWHVLVDDCAKTCIRTLDRSVDQRELRNIVLMDHTQYWSFRNAVHLRVLKLGLVDRLRLVEAVGRDQLGSVVLRHTVQSVERLGKTGRCQAIDRGFEWPPL